MQKQTTLFSFFNRTPKSETSSNSPSSAGVNEKNEEKATASPKAPSTPLSSRNGAGTKRRRTSGGHSVDEQASKKRLKNEKSPTKDFTEGSLVWAKLDGYPWWPAMVRGESKGGPVARKRNLEYHVQFFDQPPTRAWVRKGDLKNYVGSQDADVPPAKGDSKWIAACQTADDALAVGRGDRIRKYWWDFEINDEEEEGTETEGDDAEPETKETPKCPSKGKRTHHKRIRAICSDSDEEEDGKVKKGKGDGDDEYSPGKDALVEESEGSLSAVESEDASDTDQVDESEDEKCRKKNSKPASGRRKQQNGGTPRTPIGMDKSEVISRLQRFNSSESPAPPPPPSDTGNSAVLANEKDNVIWTHMKLDWAKEGNRMDLKRRKENHPEYDSRTLYVPQNFLDQLTPAMRQWWTLKSQNFDTVLFFKVGKFYEFYHWDACVAAKELGITYMKGDHAHSGFPEIAFSRFANALVEKGYKVARIEQTETPDMLAQRVKASVGLKKHEKVIKREICQVSTKGVRYASFQDEIGSNPFGPDSAYLYAITEKPGMNTNGGSTYGVCFVDTTIGTFHVGQFLDDRHASRLRTLMSHYVPAQILHEKNKLSSNFQQLLHNMPGVRKDGLVPETEFWNAKKTLKCLAEENYFRDGKSSTVDWPSNFKVLLSEDDGLGLTPADNWELGLKCLGGITWYLKHCLLDHDLLSQKKFEIYSPNDIVDVNSNNAPSLPQKCLGPRYMVIDGTTILNLDLLHGPRSLLATLDKCGTNFGKRLLRHWLCLPLANPDEIAARQTAVEKLMELRDTRQKIVPLMKSLPDLERLLSKIHYLGSSHRAKDHPDGRAFFFEDIKYSKNKISDLISVLKGFKTCVKIIREVKTDMTDVDSQVLKQVIEGFPVLDKLLSYFDKAFDHNVALKSGKIEPLPGALQDYDDAIQAVLDIQTEADEYLRDLSRELKTRASFFGTDKKRFQVEVPDTIKVPKDFEMSSSRKGFKRYYNSTLKGILIRIQKAEVEKEDILRDVARKIFEEFDKSRDTWMKSVECIATLDVLVSLSIFSESQEVMCKPTVTRSEQPFLRIVEGRHPCVPSDSYIPNDTTLGVQGEDGSNGSFVILTGPNMGGKSTLMRQVGLLAIMSHLGCYVPAEECEMSMVDRIFTRLGANDNIGEGESTFFVEMSETSAILKHASADSLLLIDELGRGTATYDGTAIAYAVAKDLSERKCRSLFSTHYHTLVEALHRMPAIQMCHMACMVENENEEDPTQESITFLYKMISGPCPKSYGFNAARLAGITDDVIRVAHKKAKEFEASVTNIRSFTEICASIRHKTFSLDNFASLAI